MGEQSAHDHGNDPSQQEIVLQGLLYDLILAAARWSIPVMLLHFPRITQDRAYLYERLQPLLGKISFKKFVKAFKKVSKPELVHHFQPAPQETPAAA